MGYHRFLQPRERRRLGKRLTRVMTDPKDDNGPEVDQRRRLFLVTKIHSYQAGEAGIWRQLSDSVAKELNSIRTILADVKGNFSRGYEITTIISWGWTKL
jgi:hypothetical protein